MQIRGLVSVLSCAVASLGIHCAQATLIVVAYDETNIYIAADSRIGRSGKFIDGVCKIKQVGHWFMARAGWFETVPNGKTIQDRLVEADTTGRNLPEAFESLRPVIAKEFTFLVQVNKRAYPETYKEIVSRGTDELAHVLLCGYKGGRPCIELTFWKLRFDTNQNPFVTAETEVFPRPPGGQLGFQVLGQNGAIRKAMQDNPNFLAQQRDDPVKLLRHCAQLELESLPSDDSKQYVGLPIDILHMTPRKAEWIQRKPECADIVPYWE